MSGGVSIAYQVVGESPLDLVMAPRWVSNRDVFWEEPAFEHFLRRLASFSRLILFGKRGTGLSDRAVQMPSLRGSQGLCARGPGRGRLAT